jgi:hypothetical protein
MGTGGCCYASDLKNSARKPRSLGSGPDGACRSASCNRFSGAIFAAAIPSRYESAIMIFFGIVLEQPIYLFAD